MIPDLNLLRELSIASSLNCNLHKVLAEDIDKNLIVRDLRKWEQLLSIYKDYLGCKDIKLITEDEILTRTTSSAEDRALNVFTWLHNMLTLTYIVDDYDIDYPNCYRIVDMRYGRVIQNGYRGVHMLWQLAKQYYPIQIKFFTKEDYFFNKWCESHIEKDINYFLLGDYMRQYYDKHPDSTWDELTKFYLKAKESIQGVMI